ncbi:MAG: hypothetical protein ABI120_11020 [Gemmatimonadaceae bacterium]
MGTTTSAKWMARCCTAGLLGVLASASASVLCAQERAGPVSFDVGTGAFSGKGDGQYSERSGLAIAGQLSGRVFERGATGLLLAFNVSGFSNLSMGDDCIVPVNIDGTLGTTCLPEYPSAVAFALMAGVEHRFGKSVAVRALAGPARFNTNRFGSGAGAQSRVDVSVPANTHLTFLVWGQHGFMPVKGKPRERVRMFGIGMRIQ